MFTNNIWLKWPTVSAVMSIGAVSLSAMFPCEHTQSPCFKPTIVTTSVQLLIHRHEILKQHLKAGTENQQRQAQVLKYNFSVKIKLTRHKSPTRVFTVYQGHVRDIIYNIFKYY